MIDGGFCCVSLVAQNDEGIVGHVLFSHIHIVTDDRPVPAISLAPLAMLPPHQRKGAGARLVQTGLERCRQAGQHIVLVLGEPAYYERFGFRVSLAARIASPFPPEYFMACELQDGAIRNLSGRVVYSEPFGIA